MINKYYTFNCQKFFSKRLLIMKNSHQVLQKREMQNGAVAFRRTVPTVSKIVLPAVFKNPSIQTASMQAAAFDTTPYGSTDVDEEISNLQKKVPYADRWYAFFRKFVGSKRHSEGDLGILERMNTFLYDQVKNSAYTGRVVGHRLAISVEPLTEMLPTSVAKSLAVDRTTEIVKYAQFFTPAHQTYSTEASALCKTISGAPVYVFGETLQAFQLITDISNSQIPFVIQPTGKNHTPGPMEIYVNAVSTNTEPDLKMSLRNSILPNGVIYSNALDYKGNFSIRDTPKDKFEKSAHVHYNYQHAGKSITRYEYAQHYINQFLLTAEKLEDSNSSDLQKVRPLIADSLSAIEDIVITKSSEENFNGKVQKVLFCFLQEIDTKQIILPYVPSILQSPIQTGEIGHFIVQTFESNPHFLAENAAIDDQVYQLIEYLPNVVDPFLRDRITSILISLNKNSTPAWNDYYPLLGHFYKII